MSISRNTFVIIISNTCTRAISFASGIVSRRMLGPQLSGLWSWIQMIATYAVSVNSGIEFGGERDIPFYRGRGDTRQEHLVRHQMFTSAAMESTVVAALLGTVALIAKGRISVDLRTALYCAAGYVVLWRLTGCFMIACRAGNDFVLLGKLQVAFALMDLLLIVVLVPWLRIVGQYLAFGLGLLARVIVWLYFGRVYSQMLSVGWYVNRRIWESLMGVGLPLMLNGLLWQLLISVDGLIVGKVIGFTALGYYGMGISTGRAVAEVPNAFSSVVFPRLMEDFGKSSDSGALGRLYLRNMRAAVFVLIPPIICLFYFALPVITVLLLPKFVPAIPVIKLMTISAAFLSLTHMSNQILIALKRMRLMLCLLICTLLFVAGSAWMLAPQGIWVVALAVMTCYFVYCSVLFLTARILTVGFADAIASYASLFAGLSYTVATIVMLDFLATKLVPTFRGGLISASVAAFLLALACQTLLWRAADKELQLNERLHTLWTELRTPAIKI